MITQSEAAAMEKHQRSSWCAWACMGPYALAKACMRPRTATGSQEIVMDEPCDWPDPSSWWTWRLSMHASCLLSVYGSCGAAPVCVSRVWASLVVAGSDVGSLYAQDGM